MKRISELLRLASMGLVVVAIVTELRKPAEERTWHGCLFGFIPYDFRFPTFNRVQAAWWNPRTAAFLTPTPFGVGWTINFGAIWQALTGAAS